MTTEQAICDQVVSSLRGISRALDLHYKWLLREYGLSGPQIVVLKSISVSGQCPTSAVARNVHLSHATVTAIVDRLVQKGFVNRVPNEQDRREVHLQITDEGKTTVDRSPPLLHEKFIREFTALDIWEQNHILASLQRVAQMIGAPESQAPMLSIAPLAGESLTEMQTRKRRRKSDK
jgi:DNA-binding MarR family transcriptional regulator